MYGRKKNNSIWCGFLFFIFSLIRGIVSLFYFGIVIILKIGFEGFCSK